MKENSIEYQEQRPGPVEKWRAICKALYRHHDMSEEDDNKRNDLEIWKMRKRIIDRGIKEFFNDGQTAISYRKFQIILKNADKVSIDFPTVKKEDSVILKFIRMRDMEIILNEIKDLINPLGLEFLEVKKGCYLLKNR